MHYSNVEESRKDAVAAVNQAVRSTHSNTSAGPAAQAAAIVYLADVLRLAFVK